MVQRRISNIPFLGWQHPFTAIERMARQWDALLREPGMPWITSKVFPTINASQNKDTYFVRAELPGMKAADIQLEVTGNKLAISGERKIPSEGEKAKYHRKEREEGRFSRVIELPGEVDAGKVSAKMVNGLLTIEAPKLEAAKAKKITIQ